VGKIRSTRILPGGPHVTRSACATRVERVAIIDIEAFDWNCPRHIMQRFTLAEVERAAKPLRERITVLETELQAIRVKYVVRD